MTAPRTNGEGTARLVVMIAIPVVSGFISYIVAGSQNTVSRAEHQDLKDRVTVNTGRIESLVSRTDARVMIEMALQPLQVRDQANDVRLLSLIARVERVEQALAHTNDIAREMHIKEADVRREDMKALVADLRSNDVTEREARRRLRETFEKSIDAHAHDMSSRIEAINSRIDALNLRLGLIEHAAPH